MTKMLRIIHALDKQTNSTKNRTDFLKHEIDQLRKALDKSSCVEHDGKSDCDSSKSCDTSSVCDTQSNDSSCSTLSMKSHMSDNSCSLNSNCTGISVNSLDCNSQISCATKDSTCTTQTSCSYDEFHKFKTEVLHMLHDLAKQINDQMGMLANIMSSIAVVRKPSMTRNH